ncbi:MAG: thioredoxin domain-containing protein [Pseudomonadota bacterium]
MTERLRITHSYFKRSISHGVTLVDFDAPWSSPCRAQKPVLETLKSRYRGKAAVQEINIDENPAIAMDFGIQSIPTTIIFKEGREIFRFIGLQPRKTLEKALRAALS